MTSEQHLIRLYQRAARRLRQMIGDDLRSGRLGTAAYRTNQLNAIRVELAALGRRTRTTPVETVAQAYDRGAAIVDRVAGDRGAVSYAFTGTHTRTPQIIAENLAGRLDDARANVGRQVNDVYRRAALEAIGEDIAAGEARRQTSLAIERRLIHEGVTGFIDRRGAHWALDTYAEMATRTTTREAVSAGTRGRMLETGQDLITISDHATETDICKEFEGKTYSITGRTPGYEVLPEWPPFHPRCLHVATPAAENVATILAELGLVAPTGAG